MKKLTILATEDVNKEGILDILDKYLEGYTVLKAKGVWRGVPEDSLLIYIVDAEAKTIEIIIHEIKETNNQESIMVLTTPCGVEFK